MPDKACEYMRGGIPNHAMPMEVHFCADGRRDKCPYLVFVDVDTDYVTFKQEFCGFMFRKNGGTVTKAPPEEDEG
jgi:hypothetical protein